MQIRALKTFRHGAANVRRGTTAEIPDAQAKDLIKAGLAQEDKGRSSPQKGGAGQQGSGELSAADLIAKADEMPLAALKAEAKRILGNEAPAKKDEILAALQAKVSEG